MRYNVTLDKKANEDFRSIPKAHAIQIGRAIAERLSADPAGCGKPLRHELKGAWRLRVGDWRILYRIDGKDVIVFAIVRRRDAY